MNDHSQPRLVFIDDKARSESIRLFGCDCTTAFTDLPHLSASILALDDPNEFLERLSNGGLLPDAVLLDMDFSESKLDDLSMVDPPSSAKETKPQGGEVNSPGISETEGKRWAKHEWGKAILKTIKRIDPDMPVMMLTVITKATAAFDAGRFRAEDYFDKATLEYAKTKKVPAENFCLRLQRAIQFCKERAVYDHAHLKVIDNFAASYDKEERSKCATSAYYRFENALIGRTISTLAKSAPGDRRLQVLDLGCGTGRIEEVICRDPQWADELGNIEIAAVDFSGRMLEFAYKKLDEYKSECRVKFGENCPSEKDGLLHVSLFRAPAENLEFLSQRYPGKFDLAILGFGFLSYVKYTDVLPAEIAGQSTSGLVPLLKTDAEVLFSVYNENSVIYDRIRTLPNSSAESDLPIAALMNLATGCLQVSGAGKIACEAFRWERVMRFIRQAGLSVDPEDIMTFPTVHMALQNSLVMSQDEATRLPGFKDDPILKPGRYSPSLIELDAELSRALKDKGHYVVGLATKGSRTTGLGGANGH